MYVFLEFLVDFFVVVSVIFQWKLECILGATKQLTSKETHNKKKNIKHIFSEKGLKITIVVLVVTVKWLRLATVQSQKHISFFKSQSQTL